MQKQKENLFREKFRLLNSQEYTEEIIWSLSDSSEYDEPDKNDKFNTTNKTQVLKRKRKKKTPTNISNLNITVLNTSQDNKELQSGEISPILLSKKYQNNSHRSPILPSSQICRNCPTSPILPICRVQKSPILTLKSVLPKPIGSIKKKLFTQQKCGYGSSQDTINVKTEVNSYYDIEDNLTCRSSISELADRVNEENRSKIELISKVKSFFNNHFSSESSSQNSESISDIPTQRNSTKTSDEIEILTCKTETASRSNSIDINPIKQEGLSDHSSENQFYAFNKSKRKVKYKKDGIAYRLHNLLKKQNACLSLWHHERFLAANSNFILPKEENTVFRIQKVHYEYGCYLLEAVDLNEDNYLVLINSCYVSDTILSDTIIKVYEPFRVVEYNEDIKLLINVCRFQCSQYIV